MASITIRNLEESVKAELRIVAASHGHSMEEEARTILRNSLRKEAASKSGLGQKIHQRFMSLDFESPELPERMEAPRLVDFDT